MLTTDLLLNIPFVLIAFLALVGVLLTIYIHYKKSTAQPMVCPLNGHCESVIRSEFSKFLGMPVELMGMLYYAAIAMGYIVFLSLPAIATSSMTVGFFIASMGAFLFSLYLIFIQVFFLKQYCTWCLGSAAISTVIFLLSVYATGGTAITFFAQYTDILLSVYSIGLALGLGSASLSVLFLAKFLRDLHISKWEADGLHTISQVTWLALAMLSISGFAMYISPDGTYSDNHFSLSQAVLLLVMIGAGALLDLLVTPRLVAISNGQMHDHKMGELRMLRKSGLALSVITLISWYMSFILATISNSWSAKTIFITYGSLVLIGILASQVIEGRLQQEPQGQA